MIINVHLHTVLQKRTENGLIRSLELTVPDLYTVADVLTSLEIKMDPNDLLVTVNGQVTDESQVLTAGDRIDLIPAISGGTDRMTSALLVN